MHWLVWLWGCGSVDPALVAQREALDAWEDGKQALEGGMPGLAANHFLNALEHQPGDRVLMTWHAAALAEGGESEAAFTKLDLVLGRHPDLSEARYYRAIYQAQQGDITQAAEDLTYLYQRGVLDVQKVRSEEAFTDFLTHPAMAFLPEIALSVTASMQTQGAFEGTMVPVQLRVESPWREPIQVSGGFVGPVELRSVFERWGEDSGGLSLDLTYRLRVMGKGEVTQGPWTVEQGPRRQEVEAVTFLAVGKDEDREAPVQELEAYTPSALLARMGEGRARVVGRDVEVRLGGSERAKLEPQSAQVPVRYVKEDPQGVRVTVERHLNLPGGEVKVHVMLGPRVMETTGVFIPVN